MRTSDFVHFFEPARTSHGGGGGVVEASRGSRVPLVCDLTSPRALSKAIRVSAEFVFRFSQTVSIVGGSCDEYCVRTLY
jgi:hypothetical protein